MTDLEMENCVPIKKEAFFSRFHLEANPIVLISGYASIGIRGGGQEGLKSTTHHFSFKRKIFFSRGEGGRGIILFSSKDGGILPKMCYKRSKDYEKLL